MNENDIPFTVTEPESYLYSLTANERAVIARSLDVTAKIKAALDDDGATVTLTELRDRFAVQGQDFA